MGMEMLRFAQHDMTNFGREKIIVAQLRPLTSLPDMNFIYPSSHKVLPRLLTCAIIHPMIPGNGAWDMKPQRPWQRPEQD